MGVPHRPEGCSGPLGARPPARPPSGEFRADHERGARRRIAARAPRVCVASSDVHEHGKNLIEHLLHRLGTEIIDGDVSADEEDVVAALDAIALATPFPKAR